MDLPKIFKNSKPEHSSNLTLKIGNPPKLESNEYFCMWSDLLGFGNIFFENNWMLDENSKRKIYGRLQKVHSIVLYNSNFQYERNLILNDGIAKVFNIGKEKRKNKLFSVSLFLRSCIQNHIQINQTEKEVGFPGCRTVLSYGEGVEYLTDEIRLDDYVLNYTKPKGEKISKLAKDSGNPIIIYNPKELQMNMAFAKAYTLESGGSKIGIKGNNFYIEESVLQNIQYLVKEENLKYVISEEEKYIIHSVPYKLDNMNKNILGFKFSSEVIEIEIRNWKTKVYELIEFYPHDEDITEFTFELNN